MSLNNVRKAAAVFLTVVLMLMNAAQVFAETESALKETVIFQSKERGYKDPGTETRIFDLQEESAIEVSGTQFFQVRAETDDQKRLTVTMSPRTGLGEGTYEEYVEVSAGNETVYSAMLLFEVTEIKWPRMITELNIEVQDIEAGYICSDRCTADLTDYTGGDDAVCTWKCIEDDRVLKSGVDIFESGKTYQAQVGFFVEDGKYYFGEALNAYINGVKADINLNTGDKKCLLTCSFGPLKANIIQISKISLEIKPPASGSTQFPRVSVLGGKGYSVSTEAGALKVYSTFGSSLTEMAEGEPFRSDMKYLAEITLVTDKKDYRFSENCAAEVNGEAAEAVINENGSCTVKCEFRPEEIQNTDSETVPKEQITNLLIVALMILAVTVTALVIIGKD